MNYICRSIFSKGEFESPANSSAKLREYREVWKFEKILKIQDWKFKIWLAEC